MLVKRVQNADGAGSSRVLAQKKSLLLLILFQLPYNDPEADRKSSLVWFFGSCMA